MTGDPSLGSGAVPSFTVSCGLSDSHRAETFQDVVAQADEALLSAKRSGRNRIELTKHTAAGPAANLPVADAPLQPDDVSRVLTMKAVAKA